MVHPQTIEQVPLEILPSYILLLAILNEFITAFKAQLSLTDDDIRMLFSERYSILKDTLLVDTVIRQTLKQAYDHLDELNDTFSQIKEAQAEAQQLEDNDILLDTPTPDFDFVHRDISKQRKQLQKTIDALEELLQRQANTDDDFAADCDDLIQKIMDIFKQQNLKVSSEKIGLSLIKSMNIIRKKIGIEDLIKRGESVAEEAMQNIELDHVRDQYAQELLHATETGE
jgi:hypothetical protein